MCMIYMVDNTTIVVTKETFTKLNAVKKSFQEQISTTIGGMIPRMTNDQFISVLLDGRVTLDTASK